MEPQSLASWSTAESMELQTHPVVGRIVGTDENGCALVDFPANERGPVPARSTVPLPAPTPGEPILLPVLLVFENGDPTLPIIAGLVRPAVIPETTEPPRDREAKVDGDRVVIEGKKEVVLRCGEAAIILRRDGKVIVRGAEIVSRATRSNKIKGATVHIN